MRFHQLESPLLFPSLSPPPFHPAKKNPRPPLFLLDVFLSFLFSCGDLITPDRKRGLCAIKKRWRKGRKEAKTFLLGSERRRRRKKSITFPIFNNGLPPPLFPPPPPPSRRRERDGVYFWRKEREKKVGVGDRR